MKMTNDDKQSMIVRAGLLPVDERLTELWRENPADPSSPAILLGSSTNRIYIVVNGEAISQHIRRWHAMAGAPNVPDPFTIDGLKFTIAGLRHFIAMARRESAIRLGIADDSVSFKPINGEL